MTALPLLDWQPPAARASDPDTSHAAALRNLQGRCTDRRDVLLAHASRPDGLTDFELAEAMGRQQTSVGKRRGELRDLGLVAATEERRASPSGSPAVVWAITERGKRVAGDLQTPEVAFG